MGVKLGRGAVLVLLTGKWVC
ncbi:hypothetical protein RDI58_021305 [Solanum bulbocastanum]|uniref:Uncharacterized protein n=1 Tax=Solanum bulbocastanum TaxID=147425 RepID=A0AAN8YBI0_SOLBU